LSGNIYKTGYRRIKYYCYTGKVSFNNVAGWKLAAGYNDAGMGLPLLLVQVILKEAQMTIDE
jgi:hypothetical protein